MSQFDDLVEDYAHHPVPAEKTVSGLRIALIIVGVAITLPAFLTGATLGQQLGLHKGVTAFLFGGLLVAAVGAMTGAVGARTGLPTGVIIQYAFGRKGAYIVNAVLLAAFFGWFGVTVALFAQACGVAISDLGGSTIPPLLLIVAGSAVMIGVTVFGFKALDKMSLIAVPFMVAFLIALVFKTASNSVPIVATTENPEPGAIGLAASAVAGAFMVGATMMPDLCRYARSSGHAVIASLLAFGVGYPAVLTLAAIPAVATGQTDMLKIVFAAELGLSGFILIIFASLTTNANNLYSSSLVLSALVTRVAKWKLVVVAGILGTAFAAVGIMEQLIGFLILLGVVIPPIAGIIAADHWLTRRRYDEATLAAEPPVAFAAIVAWISACGVAYATTFHYFRLTGLPAMDSILASLVIYVALRKLLARR